MTEQSLNQFLLDDRWRLQNPLGSGADGVLFLARDETSGDKVAVRVWDSQSGHKPEKMLEKFGDDSQSAQILECATLVKVLGHGVATLEGDRTLAWIAMEFFEGQTLRESLDRRVAPMAIADALEVTKIVLGAVATVHRAGFVHRDLKPENIFLLQPHTEAARKTPVRIFDFGVARPADRAHLGAARGTPMYCAPEVAQRAARIGPQSDVYSLGIILYEMLTGKPPVDPAGSPAQLVAQHVYGELEPLPESLGNLPVGQVYKKATQKDPDARYRDAGEMLTAIAALRPIRVARLPSNSPFSSPTVDDSVQGTMLNLSSTQPILPNLPPKPTE